MSKRILSGVQPSGNVHLGNYFGAIQQHIGLQNEGFTCYYFIADFHAPTGLDGPKAVRENSRRSALGFLAFGLGPERGACLRVVAREAVPAARDDGAGGPLAGLQARADPLVGRECRLPLALIPFVAVADPRSVREACEDVRREHDRPSRDVLHQD